MFSTESLLVGIDIHRKTNVIQLMNGQGERIGHTLRLPNNRSGTQQLADHLAQTAQDQQLTEIHIGAEATGNYWLPFFSQLDSAPALASHSVLLYPFNPRVIHNFRKSLGDWDKTDDIDSTVIVERLRFGRELPAQFHMEDRYLPLRTLTRHRYHLVQELVRVKSYTLSQIYLKASEYTRLNPFSDTFGATSQAVLKELSSEQIVAMPFDDLVEWIDVKGKRRFAQPEENAKRLLQVAQDSYQLPDEWLESVDIALALNLRHLTVLKQLLQRLDSAISDKMEQFPNTLTSVPGIGPVFAAGIIAEIGDLERFGFDQAKVASFAGLKWSRHQSADFEADNSSLKRTGSRFLRYYLCEAAQHVRMHDPEYKAFYLKKYNEVRRHQHKRAIVLTARKLVRLVVTLLRTHQPYRVKRGDLS